ncbi:MAG: hypothetical protein J6X97_05125 [Lachnospiraceae bacterium]|nr:hypothetical protein [Lachnospiraceae bacterium]
MPFCPKCKAEYREGFVMCADCKVPLVESLEAKRPVKADDKPDSSIFMSFEDYARLTEEDEFGAVETEINTDASPEDLMQDASFVAQAQRQPSPEEVEKIRAELIRRQMAEKQEAEYVSKKDKAGEYLSTGIMLIVMGALGCIFIALLLAGVIPFLKVHGLVSIIIDVIMFLFFAMFVYFGIHSLTRYKDYKVKAVDENNENAEFEEWFKNTITMSFIDSDLEITDDEQTNFFKRNAKIKYLISQNFPSVSESLADLMIDKYYGDIFE